MLCLCPAGRTCLQLLWNRPSHLMRNAAYNRVAGRDHLWVVSAAAVPLTLTFA
jgi:hypothetical protein